MRKNIHIFLLIGVFFFLVMSCEREKGREPDLVNAVLEHAAINGKVALTGGKVYNVPNDSVVIRLRFSAPIDTRRIDYTKTFLNPEAEKGFTLLPEADTHYLSLRVENKLDYYTNYNFTVEAGEHLGINLVDSYRYTFITELDSTPKFPHLSDEDLLTLVQQQTFKYFWDYAHPMSGLARERLGSGETVTSGGSGFGVMTIPVAIERGFVTREEGFNRLNTIVTFLYEKAERFHGVYSHWLNGTTGKAIAFSTKDNGADLVETALLLQGLLTVHEYFKNGNAAEKTMCKTIQKIWNEVEWSWFQKNNENKLYWHWSPNYGWDMNLPIAGWNESLIVYLLAASSTTYPIDKAVYDEGWARNGAMQNGRTYYDISLPLGPDKGGPLFFAHYSFLGLDPRNLSDSYANYWEQNRAHALINHRYCVQNPKDYFGYSENCWGLTASDIPTGYTASSPTNDGGTIAPTAALASFPYTPEESMKALRFYYYVLGDKLWGEYGFKDAFNLSKQWFAGSYLAIDQGPVVVMIENYRTGLLWDLFMQNSDIVRGLDKLGFSY